MSKNNSYNYYFDEITLTKFEDKEQRLREHIKYMMARTQEIFEWDGLPETIPQRTLELYLQEYGHCAMIPYQGNLYIVYGGLGGKPDVNYMPTIYTVANPALNMSKVFNIDEDCVLGRNDDMFMGLMPLNKRYATMLVEHELTMLNLDENSRQTSLISAPNGKILDSIKAWFTARKKGATVAVSSSLEFADAIKVNNLNPLGSNAISQAIELEQYIKSSWFQELGLSSQFNMKREALNDSEVGMNDDILVPLVDNMLRCREEFAEKCNEMFGTNISVKLASAWEDNQEERELSHEEMGEDGEDECQDNEDKEDNNDGE